MSMVSTDTTVSIDNFYNLHSGFLDLEMWMPPDSVQKRNVVGSDKIYKKFKISMLMLIRTVNTY